MLSVEKYRNASGFSLIELLMALALFGIATGAMFSVYLSQSRMEASQNEVVDMQQNLRVGLDLMAREIRSAGMDPTENAEDAGIVTASGRSIRFRMDLNSDWDTNDTDEDVTFRFAIENDGNDDGIADPAVAPAPFGRLDTNLGNGTQPFVDGIEAVGFAYAFDSDNLNGLDRNNDDAGANIAWAIDSDGDGFLDRELDTNDDGIIDINDAVGGAAMVTLREIKDIRAVQVWLLGRSVQSNVRYRDPAGTNYVVAERRIPGVGDFRRKVATTIVKLRNPQL